MSQDLLQAGKIVNTHALRGEVRIYPYCDSAEFICEIKTLYIENQPYTVSAARPHKGQALVRFKGINRIEDAEPLVGKMVYFSKKDVDLEDDRYFIDDIIGMTVEDINTGKIYGKVTSVFPTGANDVFEIKGDRTLYVPKINDVVKEIRLDEKRILIQPLEGLFE